MLHISPQTLFHFLSFSSLASSPSLDFFVFKKKKNWGSFFFIGGTVETYQWSIWFRKLYIDYWQLIIGFWEPAYSAIANKITQRRQEYKSSKVCWIIFTHSEPKVNHPQKLSNFFPNKDFSEKKTGEVELSQQARASSSNLSNLTWQEVGW